MEIKELKIPGLFLIQPDVFYDVRGYFFESYNKEKFRRAGLDVLFVQDNQSCSVKRTLRGLHFQNPPWAQGKLVSVTRGAVLDVAVDIRKASAFYGKYCLVELSETNKSMFWIPPGFAHGFLALHDDTVFVYKCTQVYNKESECGLRWNDPLLNINWGIENPLVSDKDQQAGGFGEFVSEF